MKTFNAQKFLSDFHIPIRTEGPHSAPGWIQICCPLCSPTDTNYHGGFKLSTGRYHCWRCGWHPVVKLISQLVACGDQEANRIWWEYQSEYIDPIIESAPEPEIINKGPLQLPWGCRELYGQYRSYLESRRFDPDYLERKYNLQASGHLGMYRFRIMAPIHYNLKMVSYQGRDITNESDRKYLPCQKEEELIRHKKILYNLDNCLGGSVIVVEGIADVWRLGNGAAAVFGMDWTEEQVALLYRKFQRVFVIFDNEPQAQEQAHKMASRLSACGRYAEVVTIGEKDPGEMSDEGARVLKQDLIGG